MTSYEFEVAAKNAVIKTIHDYYGEDYIIGDIQVVWFAHVFGNKKAMLIDMGPNFRVYEVTYRLSEDEMYVDTYKKENNSVIKSKDIDKNVHK